MTLGGRGREIAAGSRQSGSHRKVQGSIMRPCLKAIREREETIETGEISMGPCWGYMIQDTNTGWPGSASGCRQWKGTRELTPRTPYS